MKQAEIEKLKTLITDMSRKGCRLALEPYGIRGRLGAVGFKPLFTSPADSLIEKIQLHLIEGRDTIRSYNISNVVDYKTLESEEGRSPGNIKSLSLELTVLPGNRTGRNEAAEKITLDLRQID